MKMKRTKNLFHRTLLMCIGMFFALGLSAQSLKGNVQDEHGEPIIGASVVVKGLPGGAVTDLDGNFALQCKEGATLTVTYVGFVPQDLKAKNGMTVVLRSEERRVGKACRSR